MLSESFGLAVFGLAFLQGSLSLVFAFFSFSGLHDTRALKSSAAAFTEIAEGCAEDTKSFVRHQKKASNLIASSY